MNRLVDDLHTVTAIESGRFTVEPRPVSLKNIMDAALLELEPSVVQRSLRLEHHTNDGNLVLMCYRERLLQVFGNLVGNSIKFTPSGGSITLRAEHVGQFVRFEVSDTGAGIDQRQLPMVFKRFWRGNENRRGRGSAARR